MAFSWSRVAVLLLLLVTLETCRGQTTDDCGRLDSCGGCISGDPSLNLTSCMWQQCDNENMTGCVPSSNDPQGCSIVKDTAMCPGEPPPRPPPPHTHSYTYSPTEPPPVYSQAKFDMSSFIGGIVLVLSLQAAAFFALRFIRSKDSSYETM
ncbi:CD164 sialomucin-like 2 protein [Arapaima gigas]